MSKLSNKTALITGAAGGIGAATVKRFLAEGANVVIADIDAEKGQQLAADLGDKTLFVALDVTSEAQWQAAVDKTVEHFGQLDILVNNAGLCLMASLLEQPLNDVKKTLDVNLLSVIIGTRIAAPALQENGGGAIVNLSSAEGLTAVNGLASYIASKWAVRGYTKASALELGPRGIRVNSVHPGGVFTPMANPTGLSREEFDEPYKKYPAQRGADPEQIASTIVFFASDDSSHCMGSELAVDGGMTAGTLIDFMPGGPEGES